MSKTNVNQSKNPIEMIEEDSSDEFSFIPKRLSFEDSDEVIDISDIFKRAENELEVKEKMQNFDLPQDTSILWSKDLNLSYVDEHYNKIEIPAGETFSQLHSTGETLKESVKSKLPESQKDKKGDPKPNLLMVNIGFALSAPDKHGNNYVSYPIRILGYDFFNIKKSRLPGEGEGEDQVKIGNQIRSKSSVKRINERQNFGKQHTPQKSIHFSTLQENGPKHYLNCTSSTLEQKYNHSEQAWCEYSIRKTAIEEIVKKLKDSGVQPGTTIETIIFEMDSTRYVCENCETGIQGMMNPEYRFLRLLEEELQKQGFNYQRIKGTATRVTAHRPDGTKPSRSPEAHNTPENKKLLGHRPEEKEGKSIFQADTTVFKPEMKETDLHRRTAFISSDIDDIKHYQNSFDELVIKEYQEMLTAGENLKNVQFRRTNNIKTQEMQGIQNAFNELAALETKQQVFSGQLTNNHAFYKPAQEIHKTRVKFENLVKKANKLALKEYSKQGYSSQQLLDLSKQELAKLTDLIVNEICYKMLKDEKVNFKQLKSFSKIGKLDDICTEEVYDLLENTDTRFNEIVEAYKEYPKGLELIVTDNIRRLMIEQDISFSEMLLTYKKYPNIVKRLAQDQAILKIVLSTGLDNFIKTYESLYGIKEVNKKTAGLTL